VKLGDPFIIYGRNAIAVFVLAGLLARGLTLVQWTNLDGKKATLKSFVYDSVFVPVGALDCRRCSSRWCLWPSRSRSRGSSGAAGGSSNFEAARPRRGGRWPVEVDLWQKWPMI
jgi:hypothetical protein